jgi:hypothetical protein
MNNFKEGITRILTHSFLSAHRKNFSIKQAMAVYLDNPKLKVYIDKQVSSILTLLKKEESK